MFELKPISTAAIPRAVAKAERYRLLNEPQEAESICRDVLRVDEDNQEVLTMLLLALTCGLFLIFLGFGLMLVGASLGAGIALRVRRFRGHKLTALFLALLMLPWSLLMLFTVFRLLEHHPIVIAATSPIVLLAVPALVARGSVLLIRTHHI